MCDDDPKCPSDAVPLSVYKELESPYRDEDEMDDDAISALIFKYRLSQESVLLKLRGSEAALVCTSARLRMLTLTLSEPDSCPFAVHTRG